MTEASATQENDSYAPPTRATKLKLGALLASLSLIAAGGGVGGYGAGRLVANSDRNGDVAIAKQDRRCLTDESNLARRGINPAAVSLSSLTTVEANDCGVSWAYDNATSNPDTRTPQGNIIGSSITVSLPSTHSLETNRDTELEQATGAYSLIGKIGAIAGGFLITTFLENQLGGWILDRRQRSEDPVPSVEIAAS